MSSIQDRHWELRRQFLDQDQAREAAMQAQVIRDSMPDYAEEFVPEEKSWGNRLQVVRVMSGHMPERDAEAFAALVSIGQAVNEAADEIAGASPNGREAFFLNFYGRAASTGEHRDHHTAATVAAGLSGIATAYIRDPESRAWLSPLTLYPTDALCFDNDMPLNERPAHIVRATWDTARIAIVNATE